MVHACGMYFFWALVQTSTFLDWWSFWLCFYVVWSCPNLKDYDTLRILIFHFSFILLNYYCYLILKNDPHTHNNTTHRYLSPFTCYNQHNHFPLEILQNKKLHLLRIKHTHTHIQMHTHINPSSFVDKCNDFWVFCWQFFWVFIWNFLV